HGDPRPRLETRPDRSAQFDLRPRTIPGGPAGCQAEPLTVGFGRAHGTVPRPTVRRVGPPGPRGRGPGPLGAAGGRTDPGPPARPGGPDGGRRADTAARRPGPCRRSRAGARGLPGGVGGGGDLPAVPRSQGGGVAGRLAVRPRVRGRTARAVLQVPG